MELSNELKSNCKTAFTLSISSDLSKGYSESYTFMSLDTLIDVVKDNLKGEYSDYEVVIGDLNKNTILYNLSLGYGTQISLYRNMTESGAVNSFFSNMRPERIILMIGSTKIYQ